MPIEEVLDRVEEAGITLTYYPKTDRLAAKPTSAVTPEIINTLRSQTVQPVGKSLVLPAKFSQSERIYPLRLHHRDRPDGCA